MCAALHAKPAPMAPTIMEVSRTLSSHALHALPRQYSTEVCLGSPGRRFDLIVDTGSSITAVPCSSCKQCGKHHCGKTNRCFDPGSSPTSQTVDCHAPPPGFSCERCVSSNRCAYSVHYTEGSSISGHVASDMAHFTRSTLTSGQGINVSHRVYFGCQTHESGMFYRQDADGIMGLQPPCAPRPSPAPASSHTVPELAQSHPQCWPPCRLPPASHSQRSTVA